MNHEDTNLKLITRLSLLLCAMKPEGVRVRRLANDEIQITAHPKNISQFIGKGGERIQAIKHIASRLGNPEKVNLSGLADEEAYTNSAVYEPNTSQRLLIDLLDGITGIIPDYPSSEGRIQIPRDCYTPDLQVALEKIMAAVDYTTKERNVFKLVPR